MSPKACIISCSDHYSHRMHLWEQCLQKLGYTTQYITGDFDHFTKRFFTCNVPGCVQLPVKPYYKNLSAARILSHRMFAKSAARYLAKEQPHVVIALLPPNFLAKYLGAYKRKHPDSVLIFDIFDLWPETFPNGKLKKLLRPIFSLWANLRDQNLPAADYITTECDLFQDRLKLDKTNSETVYLCADPSPIPPSPLLQTDRLELCYLGSINNMISIPDICSLIHQLSKHKPITLHIIGTGEREQEFIDLSKAAGAEVIFYGAVYDPVKKQKIMDRCHLGLNIMKPSVCVGLTMKSVDYFRHGLPIVNSIPADTQHLLEKYHLGIQLSNACAERILSLSAQDFKKLRDNVKTVFEQKFSHDVIVRQLCRILEKILQ